MPPCRPRLPLARRPQIRSEPVKGSPATTKEGALAQLPEVAKTKSERRQGPDPSSVDDRSAGTGDEDGRRRIPARPQRATRHDRRPTHRGLDSLTLRGLDKALASVTLFALTYAHPARHHARRLTPPPLRRGPAFRARPTRIASRPTRSRPTRPGLALARSPGGARSTDFFSPSQVLRGSTIVGAVASAVSRSWPARPESSTESPC